MPQYTYPGVYVQEIPSGVHTITGVSTAVAAFVDFFKEGPMNKAVHIYGMGDFNRIFGGLDVRSDASYAISQFFQNGGTEAYVVRVAAPDDSTGTDVPASKASCTIKSAAGGEDILTVTAISEGVWGNVLRIDIDHNTADPATQFNLYVARYDSADNDARPIKGETFLNLSVDSTNTRFVENVINEESELIKIEYVGSTAGLLPAATGSMSGELHALGLTDFTALSGGSFDVKTDGMSSYKTATLDSWTAGTVTDLAGLRKYLEKAIRQADTTDATFTGAKVELVVKSASEQYFRFLTGKKGSGYSPLEFFQFQAHAGTPPSDTLLLNAGSHNVQEYPVMLGDGTTVNAWVPEADGTDGAAPTAAEIIGSTAVDPHTGMYALDYVDLFNLLCLPRASHADLDTEMDTIISNAMNYCEAKRAFFIIDIPEKINTVEEMKDWLDAKANYRSRNTATYFPRLKMADPLNEYRLKSIGASGTMAGLYSRIDGTRGVWKAPAGTEATLRGVSALDVELTDAHNGTLNPLAANCFRVFPIYGMVAWGARTLDGSDQAGSEWKYIPIRRLALFLEESLFRGTKWVVFEPNDEPLWAKIRMNVNVFMMDMFKQGAFQGSTPTDAYYVKCDGETTPQSERNKGVVNIEIGFAPLKPAEFVVLKFQQIAGKL